MVGSPVGCFGALVLQFQTSGLNNQQKNEKLVERPTLFRESLMKKKKVASKDGVFPFETTLLLN